MKKYFALICLLLISAIAVANPNIITDSFEEENKWSVFGSLSQLQYAGEGHSGQKALFISSDDLVFSGGISRTVYLKKGQYLYTAWVKGKLEPGSKVTILSAESAISTEKTLDSVDEWTYFQSKLTVPADGPVKLIPIYMEGKGKFLFDDLKLIPITDDSFERDYRLQRVVQIEPAMIPLLAARPQMDGKYTPGEYQGAYFSNEFYQTGQGELLDPSMEMSMGLYGECLYVFVKCYEPEPENIVSVGNRRDAELWGGDFVAVFVAPDRSRYYQLMANPIGHQFDEEVIHGVKDTRWDGAWKVKTSVEKNAWLAEFEIPLSDFGYDKINQDETIYLNVCRQRGKVAQFYSWSNVDGNFHQPYKFRPILIQEKGLPEGLELLGFDFSGPIQFADNTTQMQLQLVNSSSRKRTVSIEATSLMGSQQIDYTINSLTLQAGATLPLLVPLKIGSPGYQPVTMNLKIKDLEENQYFKLIDLNVMAAKAPKVLGKTLQADASGIIWLSDGNYKVGRDDLPPAEKTSEIKLYAAGNETESFQIIFKPTEDLKDIEFSFADFRSGDIKAEIAWKIKSVEYVRVSEASDQRGFEGLWPDPLVPQNNFSFVAGLNSPVWFDLYISPDTPAGEYNSTLSISGPNLSKIEIPVTLKVFDFQLPKEPALRSAYGFWGTGIQGITEHEHDLYMQEFRAHRISPYNFGANIKLVEVGAGNFTLDFRTFDRYAERYLDEFGFTSFNLEFPRSIGGQSGWDNPRYLEQLKRYGEMVEKHLMEKGWIHKAYFYWIDEPTPDQYSLVNQGMKALKEAFPNVKRLLTEQPEPEIIGSVEIWVPLLGGNYIPETSKARQEAGEESWWYVCVSPKAPYPNNFIDEPALDHRIRYWMAWKDGIEGDLYWNTVWWYSNGIQSNPWIAPYSTNPQGGKWANGDGFLFYPWRGRKEDFQPVTTQRLAQIRDGIEDYDYFAILKNALEKAKAAKVDESLCQEAEKLLTIPEEIFETYTVFTSDPEPLLKHRISMGEMIGKLKAALR